jgi:predicted RNase H-like HicB family nuclease
MAPAVQKIQGLVQVPGGYYDVEFEPLEEGGYLARVPALESSISGNTLDEAQSMVGDMVAGWLAVASEDGLPIPPMYPPRHSHASAAQSPLSLRS